MAQKRQAKRFQEILAELAKMAAEAESKVAKERTANEVEVGTVRALSLTVLTRESYRRSDCTPAKGTSWQVVRWTTWGRAGLQDGYPGHGPAAS